MAFILRPTVRKERPSTMRMLLLPKTSFLHSPEKIPSCLVSPSIRNIPMYLPFAIFPGDKGIARSLSRYSILP